MMSCPGCSFQNDPEIRFHIGAILQVEVLSRKLPETVIHLGKNKKRMEYREARYFVEQWPGRNVPSFALVLLTTNHMRTYWPDNFPADLLGDDLLGIHKSFHGRPATLELVTKAYEAIQVMLEERVAAKTIVRDCNLDWHVV
jgi:hypothetical protein